MIERSRSFRVDGIVIRHKDWGEADRIITIYTKEYGKIRMLAKGAKKIQSRKAGHVEPFTHIIAQLDRTADLPIINQVETIEPFFTIRDSLPVLSQGLFVLELMDRFTREDEGEDLPLFDLLRDTIHRLETEEDLWLVVSYFVLKLLDCLGYRPTFFQCAICQKQIQPEDQFFSSEAGGAVCENCGSKRPGLPKMGVEPLRFFRHLQRSNYADAKKANVPPQVRRQMDTILQDHLSYLLERKLNMPKFIHDLDF